MKRITVPILVALLFAVIGCSVSARVSVTSTPSYTAAVGRCYQRTTEPQAAWETLRQTVVLIRYADAKFYGYSIYLPYVDPEMYKIAKDAGISIGYATDVHTETHERFHQFYPKEVPCPVGENR